MSERQQQHTGRSAESDRDLVGRDVQAGDATAERAERSTMPMPNEEGTNFKPDQLADTGIDAQRGPDAERDEDLRHGGSGSAEIGG